MSALAAVGIDAGSTTMKAVGVDSSGALLWSLLEEADPRLEAQAARMLEAARTRAGRALPVVATGYGRALVRGAGRAVTEITCHARGVFRAMGAGGTVVDVGGQDSKVIVLSGAGAVESFSMNDKCAAGTGRFLEVMAGRLRMSLDRLSEEALCTREEASVSSTCTVFAESEIISLLARGVDVASVVRGLHRSLVKRIAAQARAAGVRAPLLLSGGVARSAAVRAMLGEELKSPVLLPEHPQLMGAYGAALLALAEGTRMKEQG